jgi:hypothetical protein
MGFNVNTVGNKSAMRNRIVAKQNLFKRFKKRYATCKNATEARFCKNEAVRIVKELKVCAKQWKKCNFGKTGWITKNCKVSSFKSKVGVSRKHGRKSTTRWNKRRTSRKSYARRTTRKSHRKTHARRTRKSYAKRTGRTYSRRSTRRTTNRRSYSWR